MARTDAAPKLRLAFSMSATSLMVHKQVLTIRLCSVAAHGEHWQQIMHTSARGRQAAEPKLMPSLCDCLLLHAVAPDVRRALRGTLSARWCWLWLMLAALRAPTSRACCRGC
jgi:hypothetical protein